VKWNWVESSRCHFIGKSFMCEMNVLYLPHMFLKATKIVLQMQS